MEETSAQRLKQIEILLATAAKTINRTTERSDRNAEAIDRLTERVDLNAEAINERMDRADARMAAIAEMFVESVGIIRQQQANIDRIQSEVRGLQVENQRILLRIFGGDEYLNPN